MKRRGIILGIVSIACAVLVVWGPSASTAHGPGGHGDDGFTPFSAAQKGMAIYDKLISSGKLDASWETGFAVVAVSRRAIEGRNEFTVKFSREQGDPPAVYVFFDEKGEYRGSNFSGE